MNYRFLEKQFTNLRVQQMAMFGRPYTEMDVRVSRIMFETVVQAMNNVQAHNQQTCMQAVSLSTGLGKSASAFALIAAFAKQDPEFSTAYVVPTIKMAIEAQEGIEQLLGKNTTTLWSRFHKHKGVDLGAAKEELGFVPDRLVNKADLPISRIIIVTHDKLKHEMLAGTDEGCLKYYGKQRSVVFIDEHPDFIELVDASPKSLQAFHDDLANINASHRWLPVIAKVVYRMSEIVHGSIERQPYFTTELLSQEEASVLVDDDGLRLWDLTNEEFSNELRMGQLQNMRKLVEFLQAASKGNVFYSRNDFSFFAYQLHFDTSYPGFVLLDATSDLAGLVRLHPNVEMVDVPEVNYERLELFHIDLPRCFTNMQNVYKSAPLGREYGKLIEETVFANTEKDSEVLVVVHKGVLTQEIIDMSDDPEHPLNWAGRRVNTQTWGSGVGLNKFKHKTHVFLFGDYYMPRAATIAHTHAWAGKRLNDDGLRLAVGRRKAGDVYLPQGDYRKPHEGHLLRWSKQLAMRGTGRQVDADGRCMHMKLFTTMDLSILLPNLPILFPNAAPPVPANKYSIDDSAPIGGRKGLVNLLLATKKSILGADEVQVATGISRSKLGREFDAISETIAPLGWTIASAKDLGYKGKMSYLVNHARRGQEVLRKVA